MSIDSLLNPITGHCKRSRCDCSCYHASEIWVSHSKYSSFESHTPPNDRLSYAGSLGVAKKCPIWPIVRTDRAIVRTHRTKGSWRKEPFHCPLSSCRQKFHSFRRLSSHFQKEHLSSSVDAAGKSYQSLHAAGDSLVPAGCGGISISFTGCRPKRYGVCFHKVWVQGSNKTVVVAANTNIRSAWNNSS